jgi:hypothetical protein
VSRAHALNRPPIADCRESIFHSVGDLSATFVLHEDPPPSRIWPRRCWPSCASTEGTPNKTSAQM